MKKTFTIIGKVFGWIILACLIIVLIINLYFLFCKSIMKKEYPMLFGYNKAVVVSGSMEPNINIGDYIIIHKQDSYQVGDVISFRDEIGVLTHRIVEVTDEGYITWGDNRETNNIPDPEISKNDVYGKVVKVVPKVGLVSMFFKTTKGIICICALGGVFVAVYIMWVYYKKKRKSTK